MTTSEVCADPDLYLGYTIVRVADVLQRRIEQRLRAELGISVRQFGALAHLSRDPGLGSAQLARLLLITPQSAGPLLGSLDRDGLVTRARGPKLGTRMAVTLTDAGKRALDAGYRIAALANDEDLNGLPPAKAREINELLLAVLKHLAELE